MKSVDRDQTVLYDCSSLDLNGVDPDQVRFGSPLFVEEAYRTFQQKTKVDNFCCGINYICLKFPNDELFFFTIYI